jgi:hypothetical protein
MEKGRFGMIIHSVYFWLKEGLSDEDRSRFDSGLRSVLDQDNVCGGYIGKPASTPPRPVIDSSYTVALHVHFVDVEAHDAYQDDPNHHAFISNCSSLWDKVLIYDAEVS